MSVWRWLKMLCRNLTRRRSVDQDLDAEIRAWQQMAEDEKIQAGAPPEAARRVVLLQMGGTQQIREAVQDIRIGVTLETLLTELRQSIRGLRRNPGLTLVGAMMLALGMGASTAMFTIFHAVLIQPLPFRDSERLVQLWETRLDRGISSASFTEANFWDLRARNQSFRELAAGSSDEVNLTGAGPAEKLNATRVTASFFRTLGVSPVLGRDLTDADAQDGLENHVVLLGQRFWNQRFGADPRIIGQTLRLNGRPYTVIGVAPHCEPWVTTQVYLPFGPRSSPNRVSFEFTVFGRLRDGISTEQAITDMHRVASSLGHDYPAEDKGMGFLLRPSSTWIASDATRRALWVLLGAVTFLLLIGCLNITNLLLARGISRQREIAVRAALGAARGRLIRFVMLESLLLSALGAAIGLGLAYLAVRVLQTVEIRGIPRMAEASLNPWVLVFAVSIALLTGLLSGLAPALHAPANGTAGVLRDGDRQTGSRGHWRLRSALVTGEVALSFVLLAGSGLLIRSFVQTLNADRGFQTENRLMFSVSMPGSYWEKGVGKQFLDRFSERLRTLPGVLAAGSISHRPVEGGNPGMAIDSLSRHTAGEKDSPWVGWRIVSPTYFRAIGLPLLAGRSFTERDESVWALPEKPQPKRRVIISERLAKLLFPGQNPIGQHATLWKAQADLEAEIVGVVADSRERGLTSDPTLTVYLPYGSNALTGQFVVQTQGNPGSLVPAIRALVASLDPNLPIADVRSFEEVVYRSVAPQRLNVWLLGAFSGIALLLATSGIYGVLAYSVSRRTSEIGLRVALGASEATILRMTVVQGMRPVVLGMAAGLAGACWLSQYFATLLVGTSPFDVVTYAGVALLLTLTALAACCVPGARAMKTDPAVALRIE